ncbi:sin3b-related [Holotrichia oblita]|uniref:Sin3b-related n=1 Tax=Holotrichia oblita TaxID=644536 RepID=A0ACB9TP31_HOLOL|nr:sin3b-related [Holotrichia oblita]
MKRLRVDETVQEGPPISGNLYRQTLPNTTPTIAYSNAGTVKVVGEGMQSSIFPPTPPASYGVMPAAAAPHSGKTQAIQPLSVGSHAQMRNKGTSPPTAPPQGPQQQQSPGSSFQRLKVEDALSYLDLVKYKFGDKPQVYNDFLDIMKEFKTQSIDTPGVIQRVSNLFNGFPDLIVGFNTFLPPGYKIEVQRSDRGYAFQVSVSVPSPTGTMVSESTQKPEMIMTGSGIIHTNMTPSGQLSGLPQTQPLSLSSHVPSVPPQAPNSNPVLHHSSGYTTASSMHNNTSHNNTIQFSAAQAAVTQALQGHSTEAPQNQPVEFNHAINYVNKIKERGEVECGESVEAACCRFGAVLLLAAAETICADPETISRATTLILRRARLCIQQLGGQFEQWGYLKLQMLNRFQGQPEKYKRFLEILHTYQKEQRTLKETSQGPGSGKHLTEQEVYSQVAKLFENQSDLLAEFGQFLPDATSHITPPPLSDHSQSVVKKQPVKQPFQMLERWNMNQKHSHILGAAKRSPPYPNLLNKDAPPPKKHKLSTSCRDVTLAEAGKYCTLSDYAFFDKVRKAVRSQDVYNNFLRCLTLFNQEIVSKSELVHLVTPFLSKFPELMKWFKDFLGQNEVEAVPYNVTRVERPQGDHALDIDYSTAKRLGTSYCVIPPAQEGLKFSGRTPLCHEVLNNQWVSFPSWAEDNSFVGSRKNQYEEYMYRCEDERFELDVVIETNASTIRVLEGVNKKLNRMSADEVSRFHLDDCLGGSSPILHQRALKRIYGDKAQDIIDGLKRNPSVAVPVVLRRLKAKEEEWREAQKGFNKIWREQNEKYYLKSLDYQGINFKQNDVKALRSKNLFNEIETLFEERNEQNEENAGKPIVGPHLLYHYRDRTILDDAANLLIHHVKRQTGIQKGEKRRIKHILRQFVPDLFFHPRQQLSDDEREEDDDKEEGDESPRSTSNDVKEKRTSPGKSPGRAEGDSGFSEVDIKEDILPLHAQSTDPDEAYTLLMASNNWYLFLRLHVILCERLAKIYERAVALADEEAKNHMVKNLLDGNMESSTYEDTLREMFGIHAYIAFTLDKVVSYAVRQLQHCVTERTAITCMEMFQKEQKKGGAGGPCSTAHRRLHQEFAYQRTIEKAVQDENCFKIYIYKKDCRLTIEMIDTDPEEPKKLEEAKKWSSYKEKYANCTRIARKCLPLYLNRNLRKYKRKNFKKNNVTCNDGVKVDSVDMDQENSSKRLDNLKRDIEKNDKKLDSLEDLERKLNERRPPERSQTDHPGYNVLDDTQCRLDGGNLEVTFTADKGSMLYKCGAFARAKETHPTVTKRLAAQFHSWLKKWVSANVSDIQNKQCTDWLMGRGDNVVPNRTRIQTNNDYTRTPYTVYNKYRVERLDDST